MAKPQLHILTFGGVQQPPHPKLPEAKEVHTTSALIVYEKDNRKRGMVVDPGLTGEWPNLIGRIQNHGLALEGISHVLITHMHQDHVQSLAFFAPGTHVFHWGTSALIGTNEYNGKVYTHGFIEVPEIKFVPVPGNAHTNKDTIYMIETAEEEVVAFIGDLAYSLFDVIPKDAQRKLDESASVDPKRRWEALNEFYQAHPETSGFYLGHYHRIVTRTELGQYLDEYGEAWKAV